MKKNDEQKALNLSLFYVFQNETLDNILSLNCANNSDGVCLPEVVITSAAVFNKLITLNHTKSEGTTSTPHVSLHSLDNIN